MNKRKSKLWKQLIAAMLAITLLATSVDLQALAAPAEETQTNETVTEEDETEELTAEEEVFLSAFQSQSYQLLQDNSSVIMNSTEQSQDSFCSGKELKNGTNE